jgi:hypothetical protein
MSDSQDQAEQLDDDVIGTESPTSAEAPVNFIGDISDRSPEESALHVVDDEASERRPKSG